MQNRNLIILITCQLISATGAIVFVTLGGIIGATLTSKLAWATLPISVAVLATAATTVPATLLMRRIGRSKGFAMASVSAALGASTAAWALYVSNFWLFLIAAAILDRHYIGCELDPEYIDIAERRIAYHVKQKQNEQPKLFDL